MRIDGRLTVDHVILLLVLGVWVDGKVLLKKSLKESDADKAVNNAESTYHQSVAVVSNADSDDEAGQPFKLPKINLQGTQCYDVPSSKRSTEDGENKPNLHPYPKFKRRRSPYGIVYNQGKPIGILEPIPRSYEFQDLQMRNADEELRGPVKRENDDPHPVSSDMAFKILSKRNSHLETKSKREISDKNLANIETNLKRIMGDLALANANSVERSADVKKRESYNGEDEDLDSGMNKIGLTKELHSVERNKKDNNPTAYSHGTVKQLRKADDGLVGGEKKIKDYRSEGESFIRQKRQQSSDIMKGLEMSGDLTVSGNKSPLASCSTAALEDSKQKSPKVEKDEKRAEDQEYEKRLQRNIENKIVKIKDEVKREIAALKGGDKKNERKKRNLLDKQKAEFSPGLNVEGKLEPHVRKRRDLEPEGQGAEQDEDNRVTWREMSDDDQSMGDLTKREGSENTEPIKKSYHNPGSYEFQYRTKRNDDDVDGVVSSSKRSKNKSGLDTEKLERLVSDSSSVSNSVKSERGARSGGISNVEVELHTGRAETSAQKKRDKGSSSEDDAKEVKRSAERSKRATKQVKKELNVAKKEAEAAKTDESAKATEPGNARLGRSSENVRQERHSEPEMSLEDMQRLESENSSKRKRRDLDYYYANREKRNNEEPNNMQFRTYRGDEDEADDESDEFDDDNFDDRTANLVRKRDSNGYDDIDDDYESVGKVNKRNAFLRSYVAEMNSDAYDNPNYLYSTTNQRKKRQTIVDGEVAALHGGGGAMVRHLAAAKERNMHSTDKFRKKRLEKQQQQQQSQKAKDQSIAALNEADIFGGLPQSYEGELSRFKRVKRDDTDTPA